ncbi:MAG: DNA repair protein RadA [Eubacteriales bacterium]|nr:DNA repair protein RadA [Eubacteriales bacterium]
MAKNNKTSFFCKECGYESSKWLGQCPSCKQWDTFVVGDMSIDSDLGINFSTNEEYTPKALAQIQTNKEDKMTTGFKEFDEVLGGGIIKGSLILLGGSPGIGKSTLLLQLCSNMGKNGKKILYVSGEESLKQIKLRADRIGKFSDNIEFIATNNIQIIKNVLLKNEKYDLLIIDSIQTMSMGHDDSLPGSIKEVRETSQFFFKLSKELEVATFLVGHITKEGLVAGPKILEHMVDTVLYFEDDNIKNLRLIRCKKNRFGSSNALAVFEMGEKGLESVSNPSEIFLQGKPSNASGCTITCILDGNRPILLEIQALVTKTSFGNPRRNVNGSDYNRLNLLIAIIEKRLGLPLYEYDIFVNITGGMRVNEPSLDLPIIVSILSSYKNQATDTESIYCGEVGLSGEVRAIDSINIRINEAMKLGYKKIFIPKANLEKIDKKLLSNYNNIEIKPVTNIIN